METNMDRVDTAARRTRRYQFEDGLVEIASGVVSLLLGAVFLAEGSARPGILPGCFSAIGMPIVVLGGGWLAGMAVRAAKARITHPRTGCVVYRRPTARMKAISTITGVVFGVIFGLAFAMLFARYSHVRNWLPLFQAVPISLLLLLLGRSVDLPRLGAVAAASVAIGLATAAAGLDPLMGTGAYFTGLALALMASGAWGLYSYLSQTQPPAEEDADA